MPSTVMASEGACSVYFESRKWGFWSFIPGLVSMLIGGAAIYWPVYMAFDGAPVGSVVLVGAFAIPVAFILLWVGWMTNLDLKVELSNSPREARCTRENILTRISTHHRYKIHDDAKVMVQDSVGGAYGGIPTWPVLITGLPRYYNFFHLGHCRDGNIDDAYAIARCLAGYLGIRMFDWRGAEHRIDPDSSHEWRPPPQPDESHRGGRRRKRRRA
jgi:hypothetical protein